MQKLWIPVFCFILRLTLHESASIPFWFAEIYSEAHTVISITLIELGNSRKYPYQTTDGFRVLTPPCLRKFQNVFLRNSLYTFYSRNPTCGIPPCLRISNRKYPPCPQNSIIVNPPSPSEILKAVRGIVWIFSGIAHCDQSRIQS